MEQRLRNLCSCLCTAASEQAAAVAGGRGSGSGSACLEVEFPGMSEFPVADEFDGAELSRENDRLKERLAQCAEMTAQLRLLLEGRPSEAEAEGEGEGGLQHIVRQLTGRWAAYSALQQREPEWADLQQRLAERTAAVLDREAAVERCEQLLLHLEQEMKEMRALRSLQLSELNQRDKQLHALQQELDTAAVYARSAGEAAAERIGALENDLLSQSEAAERARGAAKLAADQQIQIQIQIQELCIQLDRANAEIETLKSTAAEELNRTVSNLRREMEEEASSRDQAEQQCAVLKEQRDEARARVADLEADLDQACASNERAELLLGDAVSRAAILEQEVAEKASAMEELRRTIQDLAAGRDTDRQDAEQRCAVLKQQLDEERLAGERLSQQLSESRAALLTSTAASLAATEELTAARDTMATALVKSGDELRLSTGQGQVAGLQGELRAREKEVRRLRSDLAAREAAATEQGHARALAARDEDEDARRLQQELEAAAAREAALQRSLEDSELRYSHSMAEMEKNYKAVILTLQNKVAKRKAALSRDRAESVRPLDDSGDMANHGSRPTCCPRSYIPCQICHRMP